MKHTLLVLVENRPGELARVVGLFSARGFNIESLTVAETMDPEVSRITLVTRGDDAEIGHITRLLSNQVRIISAVDMQKIEHVEREMALINVKASMGPERQEALDLVSVFRAKVVDISRDGLIIEATGDWSKVSALIELLRPLGIREIARTGTLAIARLRNQGAGEEQSMDAALATL
ncbi:MAG TPA: acetolactate synthase small subunit [Blastocatellia bacterium]